MRSVVVVFPASMCAIMPMFRMRSSGVVLGIAFLTQQKRGATVTPTVRGGPVSLRSHRGAFDPLDAGSLRSGSRSCLFQRLPPVMRESPIGLRHPVRVFLLLDRLALALRGEDQLGGEALRHVLFAPGASELVQPPEPQRRASLDQVHRRLEAPLRQRLLATLHQVVQELGHRLAVVARIGRHRPPDCLLAATHWAASLGRLAPYLERDCLRSFTPAASSVPRMMW